ncbi:MAG: YbaB/EbfC family nucleoid-associated protein [Nitrospinota bacterium]
MMPRPFGNMGNMMKQAQKIQADLQKLQEELGNRTIEGTSGGGMVKAVVTGKQEVVSIEVEKEVVDPEDIEMLQDLVMAAVNEALRKSRDMVTEEMTKLTGGINIQIPGLM